MPPTWLPRLACDLVLPNVSVDKAEDCLEEIDDVVDDPVRAGGGTGALKAAAFFSSLYLLKLLVFFFFGLGMLTK